MMLGTDMVAIGGGSTGIASPGGGVTAVLVESGLLLLLLPPGPEAPTSGVVRLPQGEVGWQALTWGERPGTMRGGIGIVRGPSLAVAQLAGCAVEVAEGRGSSWRIPALGQLDLSPQPVAAHLTATGGDPKLLLDFLRHHLLGDPATGEEPSERALDFLHRYLQAATRRDGFIEIVARPECGGLLLQGWAFNLVAGEAAAGVLGSDLQMTSCILATFDRADLVAPAQGFVAYFQDVATTTIASVRHAFLGGGSQLVRLDTALQHRLLLDGPAAVEHLANMMPRLVADRRTIRHLQRVCRPRYPGHETISTLAIPVRAAVDAALLADGAGLFVTGWLLDPESRVERVFLKSSRGFYHRLDPIWARQPRPDLLLGFAADPLFAGRLLPNDLMHGFLAFVPYPRSVHRDEEFYLELLLEDGGCGFLPLAIEPARGQRQVGRLLASIPPDEPDLARIVRDHLAPYVEAVTAEPRRLPDAGRPIPLGPGVTDPEVSAVVPLGQDWLAIETLLARLATDPELSRVELVLVAGRERARSITDRLGRTMRFHGLSGQLVLAPDDLDQGASFVLGATHASARLLLCLATSVLPRERHWLGGLMAEHRASGAGLVCPTLLYEDGSIRFAGRPPGRGGEAELTGCPASRLAGAESCAVDHGPPECFLIERALLLELDQLGGGLLGPELRHLDLARRIQAAGHDCRWVPQVQLWALDDPSEHAADPRQRLAQLVDRAVYHRRWASSESEGVPA